MSIKCITLNYILVIFLTFQPQHLLPLILFKILPSFFVNFIKSKPVIFALKFLSNTKPSAYFQNKMKINGGGGGGG